MLFLLPGTGSFLPCPPLQHAWPPLSMLQVTAETAGPPLGLRAFAVRPQSTCLLCGPHHYGNELLNCLPHPARILFLWARVIHHSRVPCLSQVRGRPLVVETTQAPSGHQKGCHTDKGLISPL